MGEFVYYVGASLDGYIAQDGGGLAWLEKFNDVEGLGESYQTFEDRVGCVVMGGETYDWIREHHPGEWSYKVPCWVFTHHEHTAPEGADVVIVRGDVAEFAGELRRDAGDKDVYIVGGGDLAGQFLSAGLVDRIVVTHVPVVLGGGVPLFGGRALENPRDYRLAGVSERAGTVELDYRLA
ncbi:dihydrofolate reductase family protein [Sinomonas sp. ASV322]|uniref:dihydrofolate reductase family protein n=1 Tax=Sinomonas sp. ASV322 TaxID=3041920 RepID=UPI0027DB3B38|nr:dihydrofolate reductase family protein [Sinomonas sp. ASV322]MDQ4500937.1 dihydrofolate reductase family protein [Sinomonas sp. ASV322]